MAQSLTPTFHIGPVEFPLQHAVKALDGQHFLERLGDDHAQWTQRWRVEECTPVPFPSDDWAQFQTLLGGAA